MTVCLNVLPATAPLSWADFKRTSVKYSIALDGYVSGGPQFEEEGPRANFNHHEDVDRLATRATCAQVLMALRQGLFQTFRDIGGPLAYVYVNDCDEDVCLSWFLLKNHAVATQTVNPLLNRLVMMEDALDATAGAYPFPEDLPTLRELAWVFQPYRQFRLSGGLGRKQSGEYRSVIEDVEGRIGRHIVGQGDEIALDTRYTRIGGGDGWSMVREVGAQARTGMFADGIKAYVSVRDLPSDEKGNPRFTYVLGRLSSFVPFDIDRMYLHLNVAEKIANDADDRWGGSSAIGGSPRVAGSRLAPADVKAIIDGVLRT